MAVNSSPYGGLTQRVHEAMDELNSDETFYVPHQEAEELRILIGVNRPGKQSHLLSSAHGTRAIASGQKPKGDNV